MINRILESQYHRPTGLLGWYIGRQMARDHLPENLWTIHVLDPQPGDRILEIGFGAGLALHTLWRTIPGIRLAGVDHSAVMVRSAARRLKRGVRAGEVELNQADVLNLPYDDGEFDKVYSIHSIYFWPEPVAALQEIRRVLRRGGAAAITVLPKDRWSEGNPVAPEGSIACIPYGGDELLSFFSSAGFEDNRLQVDPDVTKGANFTATGRRV